ncbi:hypothetical protein FPQ18DRAFT_314240 [Pyronema domesticum]|nr:hypothetical protein FPQ18DRAFT_314240 [Pyronema domesticum]
MAKWWVAGCCFKGIALKSVIFLELRRRENTTVFICGTIAYVNLIFVASGCHSS